MGNCRPLGYLRIERSRCLDQAQDELVMPRGLANVFIAFMEPKNALHPWEDPESSFMEQF